MVLSCLFTVICAYLGWEKKIANRISFGTMGFLLLVVSLNGSYFLNGKNFLFENYTMIPSNNSNQGEVVITKNDNSKGLETFTLSLGGERSDTAKAIAIDGDSLYVAGSFSGKMSLDGKFQRTSLGEIGDTTDIYLLKYTKGKVFSWGLTMGSVGNDSPNAIKLDKEGNVYVIGNMGGKVDFDPSEKEYIIDAGVGQDAFIAKYDKEGGLLWAKGIGNPEIIPFVADDIRFEDATSIDIDKDNNVYLGGYFDGAIEFKDTNSNVRTLSNSEQKKVRDIFVVKYDKDGNYINSFALFGDGRKELKGLSVDDDGSLYLSGNFNSKILLNGADVKKVTHTAGGKDIFLAKYDKDFNNIWSKKWGSAGNDYLPMNSLLRDGDNFLLCANTGGYVNIDGIKKASIGGQDAIWVRFDKEGVVSSVVSFGGTGNDGVNAISRDSLGNVYVGGYFSGAANFDQLGRNPEGSLVSVSSGESSDAFIAKYDKEGKFIWANSFGGDVSLKEEIQEVSAIAVDKLDYPVLVGSYYKGLSFNSSPELDISSRGLSDGIIVKYDPEGGIK
jgi:hypothetical protein